MSFDSEMKAAMETFIVESRDLLQDMEDMLLGLEHSEDSADAINAIFRAAHTIKGSAGLFGLDHVVHFTHKLESLLDKVRDGDIPISSQLVAVLLPCRDHLSLLIDRIAAGDLTPSPTLTAAGDDLHVQLGHFLDHKHTTETGKVVQHKESDNAQTSRTEGSIVDAGNWYLSLRFGPDCFGGCLHGFPAPGHL